MSGWADLIEKAQPALLGGGLEIEGLAENSTWQVTLVIEDNDGNPVDWTDVVGEGTVWSAREGGVPIVDWDVTLPAAGVVVIRKESAATDGLEQQNAAHGVFLVKGGGAERIAICLPRNSPCPIRSKD